MALIGLVASIQSFTRIAAPYAWAWLGDRTGRQAQLLRIASCMAWFASLGFFVPQWGPVWLMFCLLFMYLNNSALMPMSEAALAQMVTHQGVLDIKRHGRVRLFGSLGFMLAVLCAGLWFEAFGMRHFPWLCCGSLVILVASACSVPQAVPDRPNQAKAPPVWPVLRQVPVVWLFASMALHVLSHMAIYVFFSLYCDELGYSKTTIGLLWATAVVFEIMWFYSQGRWLALIPTASWLVVCAGVAVCRFALIAGAGDTLWVLFAAQAMHAITFAAHHTVCNALLAQHFSIHLRGRAQALYTVLAYGIPGVMGSWAGGIMSAAYGMETLFWISSGIASIAAATAWRTWRSHPIPPQPDTTR